MTSEDYSAFNGGFWGKFERHGHFELLFYGKYSFVRVCVCSAEKNNSIWVWLGMTWMSVNTDRIYICVKCSLKQNQRTIDCKSEISFLCLFLFLSASPAGWLSECCETYCRRVKKTGRKEKKRGHAAGGSCFNIPTCCCFWICNALWRKEQTVSRAQRRPLKRTHSNGRRQRAGLTSAHLGTPA